MAVPKPFNFQQWLDENRDLLKPPVANKNLTPESDDYIVMVVAGPNARKDYHYNETEEFFYQLEGNITVKVQVDGQPIALVVSDNMGWNVPWANSSILLCAFGKRNKLFGDITTSGRLKLRLC